jgi:hypothetical protein
VQRWNLIGKHGFFFFFFFLSFRSGTDWLDVVRNGAEAEGSRWLVRALGL